MPVGDASTAGGGLTCYAISPGTQLPKAPFTILRTPKPEPILFSAKWLIKVRLFCPHVLLVKIYLWNRISLRYTEFAL